MGVSFTSWELNLHHAAGTAKCLYKNELSTLDNSLFPGQIYTGNIKITVKNEKYYWDLCEIYQALFFSYILFNQ